MTPIDITAVFAGYVAGIFGNAIRIFNHPLFTLFGVPFTGFTILAGIFAVNLSIWFVHIMFRKDT